MDKLREDAVHLYNRPLPQSILLPHIPNNPLCYTPNAWFESADLFVGFCVKIFVHVLIY